MRSGRRLFFDRRGAEANYGTREYLHKQPQTSWPGNADDPDRPSRLVRKLESSGAGCRWLLARWAELRCLLETGGCWLSPEKFKAVRLLGKQPVDAVADRDVTLVFLASHTIKRQHKNAFAELKCEMLVDVFVAFEGTLRREASRRCGPRAQRPPESCCWAWWTGRRAGSTIWQPNIRAGRAARATANRDPGVRPQHGRRAAAAA